MTASFRGNGCSAQITEHPGGFVLTLRDSGGHIFRRRRHATKDGAAREMWRYSKKWRAA